MAGIMVANWSNKEMGRLLPVANIASWKIFVFGIAFSFVFRLIVKKVLLTLLPGDSEKCKTMRKFLSYFALAFFAGLLGKERNPSM